MIFKARDTQLTGNFTLNGSQLEVVNKYTYLGVTFDSNGRFKNHLSHLSKTTSSASASILNILAQLPSVRLTDIARLNQAKVAAIMLYGAEVWALGDEVALERIQLKLIKKGFYLHPSTPGYTVRRYFNVNPVICEVIKRCLRWYNRIVQMPTEGWPRRCLKRLLDREDGPRFNWLARLNFYDKIKNLPIFVFQVFQLLGIKKES